MNDQQFKRLIEAADFFNKTLRQLVMTERGIHAETIIASAARMSGTMLFRSFVPPGSNFEPGTAVLSDQANVGGPKLMNLMFSTLKQLGHIVGEDTINRDYLTTQSSQLTLRQTQERLDSFIIAYCKAASLSFEEAAFALATAAGILVHDCRSALDVQQGAAIAVYGLIEGSKTAPIVAVFSGVEKTAARNA
ncbi:MAG: hypothetical protein EPO06_01975 [Burkholderiaceae bacterium]|nr:MAG: hypothetical protein EPO06_01975 [Burkholderiaceae bacterium]